MRKIPIEYVIPGQVLHKPVFDYSGNIIIEKNTVLDESSIKKIKKFGIGTVHILDDISQHELEDIIKPKLIKRFKDTDTKIINITSNKEIVTDKKGFRKSIHQCIENYESFIDEIIEDTIHNSDIVNNLMTVSTYDDSTFIHSINVMLLSLVVANRLGMDRSEVKRVALSCLLHDIGKIYIPLSIINKVDKLEVEEFNIIKNHPRKGYEFLRDCTDLSLSERIACLTHHEKWDGTGYPFGKSGEDIHLYGRICCLCDIFDALTSDKAYRRGVKPNEAMEYIMANGGILFDYELVKIFTEAVNIYPIGTMVLLSNGFEGIVEGIGEYNMRPAVTIYYENKEKVTPYTLDLQNSLNIVIKDIIYKFSTEE
ncbi:MAG TPA: HD-GYP domain-containing protein [Clostridiaceae bacterium]|nr:HD-GYP domain-containing protein [Clostridiaceae bacterium]